MEALIYIALAIFSIVCHYPALHGDFVFDDSEAILNNDDIDPSLTSMTDIFRHDFWGEPINSSTSHKSYRPLTVLSFQLDYIIAGGKKPFVFHVTNVILHSLVVLLFAKVVQQLKQEFCLSGNSDCFLSLTASSLFASHPIHTESVAGIVGRAELLSAILYFIAFLFYHRLNKHSHSSYVKSIAGTVALVCLAGIAMLCKEQGITILGVCFLYEIINESSCKGRLMFSSGQKMIRLTIMIVGGACLMFSRLVIMNYNAPNFQRLDNPAAFENNTFIKVTSYSYVYSLNVWLLFSAQWLCFDWSMGCISLINEFTDPRMIFVALFWISFVCFSLLVIFKLPSKPKRYILISGVFLLLPFLPSSNVLFKVGFVIAERVLYLPSAGYCLLVAFGFDRMYKSNRKTTVILVAFAVLIFSIRSMDRSDEWTTEEKLFTTGLNVCPNNAKVQYNVGKIKADNGLNDEAEKFYKEAIRLHPEYDQALNNLGNLFKLTGRTLEAEATLKKALNASPKFAAAWMNLGIVQMSQRKFEEAEKSYLNAIRLKQRYADAYYNLGLLHIETEQFADAINSLQTAIDYKPDHIEAWNNIGLIYQNLGQLDLAESHLRLAVTRFSEVAQFHSSLGIVLGKREKYNEGKVELLIAIEKDSSNARHYGNLGVIFHLAREHKDAKDYYKKALELDPSLQDTRQNLEKLLKKK